MLYQYQCLGKCGREFDELRSYENRNEVFCCGVRSLKFICGNPQVFNETKDYQFTAPPGRFGKTGVEVRGRDHYKKLMKEHGLADASLKECISVKPKKDDGFKRKQAVGKVMKKIKDEGLSGSVSGFAKDVLKMKVKT